MMMPSHPITEPLTPTMRVQAMYPDETVVQYNNLYFVYRIEDGHHVFTAAGFCTGPHGRQDLRIVLTDLPDPVTRQWLRDPLSVL